MEAARAEYKKQKEEDPNKTDAEIRKAIAEEGFKYAVQVGKEETVKIVADWWDLKWSKKFSVQVLDDNQTVFASVEVDFRFETAFDGDTAFISLSVTKLDAYMQVGDPDVA